MTDEEFAKLFPNVKWPQTFEGKNKTHIGGIGSVRYYPPTLRDRFADVPFGIYGSAPEERYRTNNIMNFVDFLGAPAFEPYNTSRAVGEGRYKDAIAPGISTAAPFLGKPTKLIAEAVRRRRLTGRFLDNNAPKPITEFGPNYEATQPVQNPAVHALDQKSPMATQGPDWRDNIVFHVPGKGQFPPRSSPWVTPRGPLRKEPRAFTLDYPEEAVADEAGNLRKDIEGRPLTGKNIAGRRKKGEGDKGLTPDTIRSIIEDDLKIPISRVPRSRLPRPNSLGQV